MNDSNKQHKTLTEGNILSSLLKFAVPVLLALFLQAMYGAVDLLVVGQFAHTADVSGVATGSMLMHTVTFVITGFAMAITIMIGESIGKKQPKESSLAIGNGICLFAIFSIILTFLLVFGSDLFSTLMHAPKEAFAQTSIYIKICGAGSLFIIAYNVLGAVFRGIGDSKTPLLTVAIACVINIIADLVFVAGFDMGAAGAALATVLAQTVSVVISLLIIRKKPLPFQFQLKDIRFHKRIIKKILLLGTPVALQELLVSISFLMIQAVVNSIGVIESAGVGVAEKVCAFLMLVGSSYMQAISAFVAQNMGAGKPERAKKALGYGIITSLLAGIVMCYASLVHGDILAGIFDNDPLVIKAAHSYMKAYGIDCIFTPFLFCFIGYFNGCEKTLFVMVQGLIGAFCVRVPIVLFVSKIPEASLFHIGLGTPASTVVQIVLCLGMFIFIGKKQKKSSLLSH